MVTTCLPVQGALASIRHCALFPLILSDVFVFVFLRCFCFVFVLIFLHLSAEQYSEEYSKGTLNRSPEIFLPSALPSPVLWPANPSHFNLSRLLALSSQLR